MLFGRAVRARCVCLLSFLALTAPAFSARAWVEAHVAADDIRVLSDRTGSARVEHRLTLKVSGGPLRALDIRGVDADAVPDPDGYAAPYREASSGSLAQAMPVSADVLPADTRAAKEGETPLTTLRIRFDTDRGLKRGTYLILVRYKTELLSRGLIQLDGMTSKVTWRGPVWEDGIESARAVFEIPTAPTPPKTFDAQAQNDAEDTPPNAPGMSFLSTVKRGPEHDTIELFRTYAPKGEAVEWTFMADARAFRPLPPPAAPKPSLGLPDAPEEWLLGEGNRNNLLIFGAIGFFMLVSLLAILKTREVARAARAANTQARPLIQAPLFVRAAGAALSLMVGIGLQFTLQTGTLGSVFVALSAALLAFRTPMWTHATALRKPGRWLPVAEHEAFRTPPRRKGAWLDISTRAGKGLFLFGLSLIAGAVWLASEREPYYGYLIGLDSVVWLALFCTGRLSELPPDPAAAPVSFLRKVAAQTQKRMKARAQDFRVIGRVRIPEGSPDADELRLGLVPKAPLPGFGGLEVGVTYVPGTGGALALPEVLLRVTMGSPCEAAIEKISRHGKTMRGRKLNERVVLFSPRFPLASMTAGIASALLTAVSPVSKEAPKSVTIHRGAKKDAGKKAA